MATPQLSQSELVLNIVAKCIINDDINTLTKALGRMPLSKLPVEKSDSLLNILLSVAAENDRPKSIEPIFKAWEQVYPHIEIMSLYSKMFLKPVFNIVMLKFLASNFEEHSFQTVVDELVSYDQSENLTYALERVLDVYGPQARIRLQNMSSSAEARGNKLVYNFFQEKLEESNEFAPIPKWVKNFTGTKNLPKESEIMPPKYIPPKYQVLNPEDAVNFVLSHFSTHGQTFDQDELDRVKDIFRAEYMTTNVFGRLEMLRESLEMLTKADLQNDIELFRVLGPVCLFLHPSPDQLEFGGSRMFLATEFDYDDDDGDGDDETPIDWFTGSCQHCHLRIRRRWHAVRRPMESGGWKGCFCSFLCLRKDLYEIETDMGFENVAVRVMIDAIEEQLTDLGIQDRVKDGGVDSGGAGGKEEVELATLEVIQTGAVVSDDSGEITKFAVEVPVGGKEEEQEKEEETSPRSVRRVQTQMTASELLSSPKGVAAAAPKPVEPSAAGPSPAEPQIKLATPSSTSVRRVASVSPKSGTIPTKPTVRPIFRPIQKSTTPRPMARPSPRPAPSPRPTSPSQSDVLPTEQ